jgi:hypothetical protein
MSAPAVRVEPVSPPFPPELQAVFDRIMPPGVPPLQLFTTLARVPRIYDRSGPAASSTAARSRCATARS